MRQRPSAGHETGAALLLTLLVVVLLAAGALLLQRQAAGGLAAARNYADAVRLRALARSGVELAMGLLAADLATGQVDTPADPWNQAEAALAGLEHDDLDLDLEIEDHTGRLRLNALLREKDGTIQPGYDRKQAELLFRLLTGPVLQVDHRRARRLVAALVDWIDPDRQRCEFEGASGAEADDYRALDLDPPPDRWLTDLAGLAGVRGMDARLLFGEGDKPGLAVLCSAARPVTGPARGRINLNTAPEPLLAAVLGLTDAGRLAALRRYRQEQAATGALADPRWPQRIDPTLKVDLDLMTTTSRLFLVRATARKGTLWRRCTCLVERPAFLVRFWREE